jgi:hypothetical protein
MDTLGYWMARQEVLKIYHKRLNNSNINNNNKNNSNNNFVVVFAVLVVVSCHRSFLPGTSLEPTVIPTTQASSFRLQYFAYYRICDVPNMADFSSESF